MTTEAVRAPVTTTGRARRLAEGTAFVAVWVALGYLLPIDVNGYLLLGVPLTIAFQLLVRRRPLRELWVRDATRLRLDRVGVALAIVLAVAPVVVLVRSVLAGADWAMVAWAVIAVAGAVPAAWALRRTGLRRTLTVGVPVALVGAALIAAQTLLATSLTGRSVEPLAALGTAAFWALAYVPVMFVLEEVAFRGALDAHVQRPGERGGPATAVVFSALWGLWHLPFYSAPGVPLWASALVLAAFHTVFGVALAYAWRRTGSLAAPGLAHALADGLRNGLMS